MPRPSSKSSSVSPSSTCRAKIQTFIKPEDTHLLMNYFTLKNKLKKQQKNHLYQRCTLPLLTFSEQARMYMGIPITTSSQAWTAPALHSDMHVFRVSSACWRRSSCSSPSDRLCCVRLSESGLFRRSYGVAYRRGSGSEGYGNQKMTHLETILRSIQRVFTQEMHLHLSV